MDKRKEIWKPIPETKGMHEISSFGRIRSLHGKGKIMSTQVSSCGYELVQFQSNGFRYKSSIHRLVARAFIPNPLNKEQVNHIDGDKLNNHLSNLEWCTRSENQKHAFKIGTQNNQGESHPFSSLTDREAVERKERVTGDLEYGEITRISNEYGVSRQVLYKIRYGLNYNHLFK